MKTIEIRKQLMALMLGASVLIAPSFALAQVPADECTKELLLSYFPEGFVKNTLQKFNVPQDKWNGIISALSNKEKDVLRIVEEKASKLNPNPFKDRDPAQRQVAVKIFRETLLQVFSEALKSQGLTDDSQFQAMLDDIQQQKAKNFAQCMEKQKSQLPSMRGQPAPGTQMPSGQPQGAPAQPSVDTSSDEAAPTE